MSIIPVRVPATAKPILASERRMAARRGHPIDPWPCPVCDLPLGDGVTVLILAGIEPESRKPSGWATGAAVAVHALCAGVPEEEPETPPRMVTFDLSDTSASTVITQALGDFAASCRAEAESMGGDRTRQRWAGIADRMREQAEAAG